LSSAENIQEMQKELNPGYSNTYLDILYPWDKENNLMLLIQRKSFVLRC
jgi:hypothetical protein